jgi:uncharacterized membrane protein YeaQ/YmgE (transglycosylase-associated protein family)
LGVFGLLADWIFDGSTVVGWFEKIIVVLGPCFRLC